MAWALAVLAGLAAVPVAVVAWCMARPVRHGTVGMAGVVALLFPLHLLVVSAAGVVAAVILWWVGAVAAAAIVAVLVVATAVMALWPVAATWRRARQLDVRLSLREYLAHARRPNHGRLHPERTVTFVVAPDGIKLELDVWEAAGGGRVPGPAIVKVHGGGWTGGGRNEAEQWNRWLNDRGYHVFDIDYRLPPPARWRDEVGDVKSALAWVAEHAADYGVDPQRISVFGHSAGGNLALLAAYSAGDPGLPPSSGDRVVPARCVVNIYGPADMALLHAGAASHGYFDQYVGGSPASYPGRYRAVSPASHVDARVPPTITVLGESDRLIPVEQAQLLDELLAGAGVAHETVLLPGNDHGFDVNWGGFGTQIARACIERFLHRYG